MGRKLLLGVTLLCLASCSSAPTPQQRLATAEQLVTAHSWRRLDIEAPPFVLTAYLPQAVESTVDPGKELTIYIEGDGLAWNSRSRRSSDPTPVDPVALQLALRHPDTAVAYLARPGQYTAPGRDICDSKYWSSHRFAPEVVAATSAAVTQLMARTDTSTVQLVGYSGGGAVAALVAAGRQDVAGLRTIAGVLDHPLWTQYHQVAALDGSLNPADTAPTVSRLRQLHFVGSKDTVVPGTLAESYLARQPGNACAAVVEVPGAAHSNGWVDLWPELLQKPYPCDRATP